MKWFLFPEYKCLLFTPITDIHSGRVCLCPAYIKCKQQPGENESHFCPRKFLPNARVPADEKWLENREIIIRCLCVCVGGKEALRLELGRVGEICGGVERCVLVHGEVCLDIGDEQISNHHETKQGSISTNGKKRRDVSKTV